MRSSISAALESRRTRFWLPFVSALVLVAGVVTFLIVYNVGSIRNTANVPAPEPSNEPAQVPVKQESVAPSKDALNVMVRFLDTAVARKNLAESYRLAAPELRQGMTLAEWKTGDIPVVPYPVGEKGAGYSPYSVEWSYRNEVMLRILLVPRKGSDVSPQEFFVGAKLLGNADHQRWQVFYFAPRWFPPRHPLND